MKFKNIIFDFGKVTIKHDPKALFCKFFDNDEDIEKFLKDVEFSKVNNMADKGMPFSEVKEIMLKNHPEYSEAIEAFDTRWIETIPGEDQGTLEIMESLRDKGYKMYGITNFSPEKFYKHKDKWTFPRYLEDIVVSGDVKEVKPEPEIFKIAIEQFGINPNESIFIDDKFDNVNAADRLGFIGIQFKDSDQLKIELEKLLTIKL